MSSETRTENSRCPSEDLIREAVAQNITRHREAAGLSQSELARRIGTVPRNLSRIEKGGGLPSIPLLVRIATELEVHPGALLVMSHESANLPNLMRSAAALM